MPPTLALGRSSYPTARRALVSALDKGVPLTGETLRGLAQVARTPRPSDAARLGSPCRLVPRQRSSLEQWLVRQDAPARRVVFQDQTIALEPAQRPEHLGRLCPNELGQ
jgi:hypothetical protein